MVYTVGETARMLEVPASTLRYYDKEGLLPFVERSSGGIRIFRDVDFEWLRIIGCMKKAGMPIKAIREYIQLTLSGDDTIDARLELFQRQRESLRAQLAELEHTLSMVEYKCWYYETAKAAGTTAVLNDLDESEIPQRFQAIRRELKSSPGKEDRQNEKNEKAG